MGQMYARAHTHKSCVIMEVTQARQVRVQCGSGLKRHGHVMQESNPGRKEREKDTEQWHNDHLELVLIDAARRLSNTERHFNLPPFNEPTLSLDM